MGGCRRTSGGWPVTGYRPPVLKTASLAAGNTIFKPFGVIPNGDTLPRKEMASLQKNGHEINAVLAQRGREKMKKNQFSEKQESCKGARRCGWCARHTILGSRLLRPRGHSRARQAIAAFHLSLHHPEPDARRRFRRPWRFSYVRWRIAAPEMNFLCLRYLPEDDQTVLVTRIWGRSDDSLVGLMISTRPPRDLSCETGPVAPGKGPT